MDDAHRIASRVQRARMRHARRDSNNAKVIAIRDGNYDAIAPGVFSEDFDKPLVANLIDTAARDISEVMAPLPAVSCQSASLASEAAQKRARLRQDIANSYVQNSRLAQQMFGGADRFGSFGFFAYVVEPDFKEKTPVIRIDDVANAYYTMDYRGRTREYFTVYKVACENLKDQFPALDLDPMFKASFGQPDSYGNRTYDPQHMVDVVRWYDDENQVLVMLDPCLTLVSVKNKGSRCPVRVVERPSLSQESDKRGQFDDVIWVQVARALMQQYTLDAIEQSVHAPLVLPKDVDEMEIGPFTALRTDTPQGAGRMNLGISPGLFPEAATLQQEQMLGSRYPEGRAGNINASVITGQGVEALMGTFDTQVKTFQQLNTVALEDVLSIAFEMDEAVWGGLSKDRRIIESGSPRLFTYTPSKDIAGDYSVDVSYGAIAGLDPNRALVFILQALAGGLIAKSTARRSLPVDLDVPGEERQIQLEQVQESIAQSIATLPQAIPQMALSGADPRELVTQIAEYYKLLRKGVDPSEAIVKVFAPKQTPQDQQAPPPSPLEQAQGAGPGPTGLPGAGSGGASDLLMSLAGMAPSGKPNLQSTVSRQQPAA